MSINTPICCICYRNYNKDIEPRTYQPCGHGACAECTTRLYVEQDDPICPQCRVPIEHNTPNYDLKNITDGVDRDSSYWGRRLMELINIPGTKIEISDNFRPFCKLICVRLIYTDTLNHLTEIYSDEEKDQIDNLKKVMCKTFRQNDVSLEDAYLWIDILSLPARVSTEYKSYLLGWYHKKEFLKEKDAVWLMDVFSL